jgi:hypothetical protein
MRDDGAGFADRVLEVLEADSRALPAGVGSCADAPRRADAR